MPSYEEYLKIIAKHQQNFPVMISPLAEELGLSVYTVNDWPDDISGMIKKDSINPSGYSIFVNSSHIETRRRFTIAHEIGHFILHPNDIGDGIVDDGMYRSKLTSIKETEANKLAADILMPWHLIRVAMSQGYGTIPQLADVFKVSRSAMAIRIGVPYETNNNIASSNNPP